MAEKQLKVHPDKTGFIAVGTKDFQKKIMQEASESPIMFGDIETKYKEFDKYLGDMIHMDGLSASVEATIEDRVGKISAATHEIKAIVDDYRMQAVGGIMGAWDLWNLAVVPSLINNCSTWIGMTSEMVDKLETLQKKYIRMMLEVPVSTPKMALRAETGLLSMKHRIWYEKVNLITAIRRMKEGLAKQVYEEQVLNGWPGLAQEVSDICTTIGIPDANFNLVNKKEVSLALRNHDKVEILNKFEKYKKLDKILSDDPTKPKDYMMLNSLADSRIIFRLRTEMMDLKDNMRNRYRGTNVNCEACDSTTAESQLHVMTCSGYAELRMGKDMGKNEDLAAYFRGVLLLREKGKCNR